MFNLKKNKRIYLDHASATEPHALVRAAFLNAQEKYWANASSLHTEGLISAQAMNEARISVATCLAVQPSEVIFTSGATESIRLALAATLDAFQSKYPDRIPHVIISSIEHSAVREYVYSLKEKSKITLTELAVDLLGNVDLKMLRESISDNTALISIQYVNNEIGTIQDIRSIAKEVRHFKRHAEPNFLFPYFHTDGSQALGVCDIHFERLGVDLLTLNPSKWQGMKGVGILVKKRGINLSVPGGGGQEFGLRSGTENVPVIVATGVQFKNLDTIINVEHLRTIRNYFYKELQDAIPEVIIHGSTNDTEVAPHILSFTIPEFESEHVVIELDARGIATASKSACLSKEEGGSYVIDALYGDQVTDKTVGAVRISFGSTTTKKECDICVNALQQIILKYKNIQRIL